MPSIVSIYTNVFTSEVAMYSKDLQLISIPMYTNVINYACTHYANTCLCYLAISGTTIQLCIVFPCFFNCSWLGIYFMGISIKVTVSSTGSPLA